MKIGLYDPYLSTLGGGENVLAVLAEVLESAYPDSSLDFIVHQNEGVGPTELAIQFNVRLTRSRLRIVPPPATSYDRFLRFDLARRFIHERITGKISSEYDLFINNTVFSTMPCKARRGIYICMFPLDPGGRGLDWTKPTAGLRKVNAWLRRGYFRSAARTYCLIAANSEFTRAWTRRYWGVESEILYPPVQLPGPPLHEAKRLLIVSVGRFFPGDHNKKHRPMIQTFIRMREAGGFEGWEYHIVGNITQVPGAREYASGLVDLAEGHPIYFHFDAPAAELTDLLRCGSLFWHATGFGEDPEREPEKLEHFGISTVEAMAYGLVPIVISMGGQPELVRDGENGYLWRSLAELESRTRELASDPNQREQMADRAYLRSQDFGREVFKRRARELVHRIAPIKAANPSD